MIGSPQPTTLNAEWIWSSDPTDKMESYAFFRREFMLDETPGTAELWVTVHTSFHLYVNGIHVVRNSSPANDGRSYLSCYDIAFALQVGRNCLAVMAHNTQVSRFTHRKRRSGFFGQLNVDGEPLLWTDEQWQALSGECYLSNQPRLSRADGFVETIDLRRYPKDWTTIEFDPHDWEPAQVVQVVANGHLLTQQLDCEFTSETFSYFNYYIIGSAQQIAATTHVNFSNIYKGARGLHAAETYIHVQEDMNVRFLLFCDDPYYVFANGNIIKSQGVREIANWSDPAWNRPRPYLQDHFGELSCTVPLTAGSTHLQFLQLIEENSAGATFVFPDTDRDSMRFLRGKDDFSFDGWNVLGKLQVPFHHVRESLDLSHLAKTSYYGYGPCDAAAHLMAYAFTAKEVWEESIEALELQQNDYTVVELERYVRGCPEFIVTGSPGDIIDVLYGEYLNAHFVLPYAHDSRRVFTIICDEGPRKWQAVSAQGIKYMMILVRQAKGTVKLQQVGVRRATFNFRDATSFSCSDELFNQIWEAGVNTLEATYDHMFLNSGCSPEGQLLADSMLQSLASMFVFGTYELSEKALREFAEVQYETGEIPAIAPSDYTVRLHDFGLLWPVWLQKHVMQSGNIELAVEMLPHLRRLRNFYKSITSEDGLLLGNLEPPYDLPMLIDYASSVDRKGISTSLNALYYNCLVKCEWLFRIAGEAEEAQVCIDHAGKLARAMRTLTWDEETGLFADGWYEGTMTTSHSLQANILAIYAGIAPEGSYTSMFEKLFLEYAPFLSRIDDKENDNPYFKFFLLEMCFLHQSRDWAADFIRYYWGKMIADGASTWWDRYCPDQEYGPERALSLCHGYGVSPNYFLITEIVGIRPAEPGYSTVYFNPLLTAVEWCRAQINTPRGTIHVDWGFRETGELEILIDSTYNVEVVPLLNPEIISDAIMHVSDEVMIAYPEERQPAAAAEAANQYDGIPEPVLGDEDQESAGS